MPRIEFSQENKAASVNYDYPKLWLKHGERARIVVGLDVPLREYVHTLRKPRIVNGKPVMETQKRRSGEEYEAYAMDFVTKAICHGDQETLNAKGSDPKQCPMCKLAKDFPDYTQPPQRRYAMHVVKYKVKPGTHDVATPFSVDVAVWGFTDKIFNQIADYKKEWGDLRLHDLLLGPCTGENYQKFEISIANKAEWLVDEERKKRTVLTLKENQIEDLSIACGNKKQRQWVLEDIELVMEAWNQVNRASAESAPSTVLDDDLNALLESTNAAASGPSTPEVTQASDLSDLDSFLPPIQDSDVDSDGVLINEPVAPTDDDDLLAGLSGLGQEPTAEEPAKSSAPETAMNFDDLLTGL